MSASDPYLQPNGVLRNKLGIQDGYEFLAYEKNFVVTRYNEMTVWGYARVSTKGQKAHGNSLEEQERHLRENGASSVTVEQFSGAFMERPKLQGLLGRMEAGDVLIVTKLDRLARNVEEGIHVIRSLIERGVKVNVLNVGLLD